MVKNLPANGGDTRNSGLITGLGRSPGEGNGNPFSVLAWKFHGHKSLIGYILWGYKELDTTEQLSKYANTHRHSLRRYRENINSYKTDVLFAKYFGESFQIISICQIYHNKAFLIP